MAILPKKIPLKLSARQAFWCTVQLLFWAKLPLKSQTQSHLLFLFHSFCHQNFSIILEFFCVDCCSSIFLFSFLNHNNNNNNNNSNNNNNNNNNTNTTTTNKNNNNNNNNNNNRQNPSSVELQCFQFLGPTILPHNLHSPGTFEDPHHRSHVEEFQWGNVFFLPMKCLKWSANKCKISDAHLQAKRPRKSGNKKSTPKFFREFFQQQKKPSWWMSDGNSKFVVCFL